MTRRLGSGLGLAVLILLHGRAAPAQEEPSSPRVMALVRVHPETADATDAAILRDQQTQLALVKSQEVIRQAIEQGELNQLFADARVARDPLTRRNASDLVTHIQKRLRAEFEGEILEIWLSSGSPSEQAKSVNAIVDALVERARASAEGRLKRQIVAETELETELESSREKLWRLTESVANEADSRRESRPHLIARLHECERQQLALRLKEAELRVRLKAAEDAAERQNRSGDAGASDTEWSVELAIEEAQRALLEAEAKTLEARMQGDIRESREVLTLKSRIAALEQRLDRASTAREKTESSMSAHGGPIEIIQRATASPTD